MGMNDKAYLPKIMTLAASIHSRQEPMHIDDHRDALAVILAEIGNNVLLGTDQITDAEHTSIEKASVTACFLAACSVPLVTPFLGTENEIDVIKLMHETGSRVFSGYDEVSRKTIVDSGILLFREIANAAKDIPKMEEWMSSVNNVTNKYVLTEGVTDNTELFAPLYLVLLMATKQMKT
jgi:hypothetical protein